MLTEEALAQCELPAGARVLDVGCGVGTTLNYLVSAHQFAAVGVDTSCKVLTGARQEHPDLAFAQAVAEYLPFASTSIAAIIAECVLSIVSERKRVLREFSRVLAAGGTLIASDVYARYASPNAMSHHILTQAQIIEQLSAYGFAVESWQDHSPALREFVAQMIWGGGTFEDFCAQAQLFETTAPPSEATRKALGYYALVARKGGLR